MIMSGSSLIRLEDVASADSPGAWFQAYLPGDPSRSIGALIERVAAAGFQHAGADRRHTGIGQPREQCAHRLFDAAASHAAACSWDGVSASALVVRHVPAHDCCSMACRTSRTTMQPVVPRSCRHATSRAISPTEVT
jgi:L-lactate dehydrogenase (cytochrome)